jgi:hypothetical protein
MYYFLSKQCWTYSAVSSNAESERLVKPAVKALSVEQSSAVVIQLARITLKF